MFAETDDMRKHELQSPTSRLLYLDDNVPFCPQ